MRLAVSIDYARDPLPQIARIAEMERTGLDMVWVPETWGYDAPTLTGVLAARTSRVLIGHGVLPVHTRTPALVAQTAATLDAVSGGRAVLGLGTSGARVVEGWHGVAFERPLTRLRETIAVCRLAWSRRPLVHDGLVHRIPLPSPPATAPRAPLAMLMRPLRARIPIAVAALRPASVEVTAELAEAWYPLFIVPERIGTVWGQALARGRARRDPALPSLELVASLPCAIGPPAQVDALRESVRPDIALYVGGMGPRGANFYTEVVGALGWADAARAIQDRYLDGQRDQAAAAIPGDMLDALTLCGDEAVVRERLVALRDAGVATLTVRPLGSDPAGLVARLRRLLDDLR